MDLLQRLWTVYVEIATAWGLSLSVLTPSQEELLKCIQRKAARMILGHSRRSPIPTACMELGWGLWSSHATLLRLRLLKRICCSSHSLIIAVASASSQSPGSWLSQTVDVVRCSRPQNIPTTDLEWRAFIRTWQKEVRQCDGEELWAACCQHHNLSSYQLGPWAMESSLAINRFIFDHSVNIEVARIVSRLFSGGQGLRGGDPRTDTPPSPRTACLHCLLDGRRVKETVVHFLYDCPLYQPIRTKPGVADCWDKTETRSCLHTACWSFRLVRIIVRAILRCGLCEMSFYGVKVPLNGARPLRELSAFGLRVFERCRDSPFSGALFVALGCCLLVCFAVGILVVIGLAPSSVFCWLFVVVCLVL